MVDICWQLWTACRSADSPGAPGTSPTTATLPNDVGDEGGLRKVYLVLPLTHTTPDGDPYRLSLDSSATHEYARRTSHLTKRSSHNANRRINPRKSSTPQREREAWLFHPPNTFRPSFHAVHDRRRCSDLQHGDRVHVESARSRTWPLSASVHILSLHPYPATSMAHSIRAYRPLPPGRSAPFSSRRSFIFSPICGHRFGAVQMQFNGSVTDGTGN